MTFDSEFTMPKGEWLSLISALLWSVSTVLYRVYGNSIRPSWITLFKGIIAIVLLSATVFFTGGFQSIEFTSYLALALSGIIGISLGDTAFFAALPKIGGSLTSAIQCLAPLVTTIGASIFLDESLNAQKFSAIVFSCAAISVLILIERPKTSNSDGQVSNYRIGILLAVCAALCQAIGVLLSRKPLSGLSPAEGAVHRMMVSVFVVAVWELTRPKANLRGLVWHFWNMPNRLQMTIASFLGTYLGLMAMVFGMTHASVGVAIAINSSYPIWVTIIEIVFLKKKFNPLGFICLLSAIAGLFFLLPLS